MKLPLALAEKLLLLQNGSTLPAAALKGAIADKMVADEVLHTQRLGKNKTRLRLNPSVDLNNYLHNHFGITDLQRYVERYGDATLTRSDAVELASHSKLRAARSFKGFLVNSYSPVSCLLNGQPYTIQPQAGTALFISDFENFLPAQEVTIVGVENAENFRLIRQQQHLFTAIQPLFISRYPQSQYGDVLQWLQSINNPYLHFGDFDFAGITIYLHGYKKYLGDRASFFVPANLAAMIDRNGNRDLYNKQLHLQPPEALPEAGLQQLRRLIHFYKKGLEQESLIGAAHPVPPGGRAQV